MAAAIIAGSCVARSLSSVASGVATSSDGGAVWQSGEQYVMYAPASVFHCTRLWHPGRAHCGARSAGGAASAMAGGLPPYLTVMPSASIRSGTGSSSTGP